MDQSPQQQQQQEFAVNRTLSYKGKDLFVNGMKDGEKPPPLIEKTKSGHIGIDEGFPYFLSKEDLLPATFHVYGDKYLTGFMELRIHSKVLFRKWKRLFFVLSDTGLHFYLSQSAWELNFEPVHSYLISEYLAVSPLYLQTASSLTESGASDYYVRIVESLNGIISEEEQQSRLRAESSVESSYLSDDMFRTICKIGDKVAPTVVFLSAAIRRIIKRKIEISCGTFKESSSKAASGTSRSTSSNNNNGNALTRDVPFSGTNKSPSSSSGGFGIGGEQDGFSVKKKTSLGGGWVPSKESLSRMSSRNKPKDTVVSNPPTLSPESAAGTDPWAYKGWTPNS